MAKLRVGIASAMAAVASFGDLGSVVASAPTRGRGAHKGAGSKGRTGVAAAKRAAKKRRNKKRAG